MVAGLLLCAKTAAGASSATIRNVAERVLNLINHFLLFEIFRIGWRTPYIPDGVKTSESVRRCRDPLGSPAGWSIDPKNLVWLFYPSRYRIEKQVLSAVLFK